MPAQYWFDIRHDDGRERRVPARFIRGVDRQGPGYAIAVLDGERIGDVQGWSLCGSSVPEPWTAPPPLTVDGLPILALEVGFVPDDGIDFQHRFPQNGHCVWTYVDAEGQRYWCAAGTAMTRSGAHLVLRSQPSAEAELAISVKRLRLAWTMVGPPDLLKIAGPAAAECEPVRSCPTFPPPRDLRRA